MKFEKMRAAFLLIALALSTSVYATGGSQADPEIDVSAKAGAVAAADASAAADATAGAEALSDATATNEGIDTTTETNTSTETSVYALSLEFPSLVGCIGGGQGGINDRGKGGFLGLNLTNVACWLQQLSASEEDLDIRARLKCGDKHYRRAINLGDRTGTVGEEMERCIEFVKPRWTLAIENERAAARRYEDELLKSEKRLEAAEDMIDLQQRHAKVCEESLERCEDKAYGNGK